MDLTAQQLEQFERAGFLVFPDLFSRPEIAVLRREVARLSQIRGEEVKLEHTGGVKMIFRSHEADGPTRSRPFRALVRTPRVLNTSLIATGTPANVGSGSPAATIASTRSAWA